jgi:hypothetical protein
MENIFPMDENSTTKTGKLIWEQLVGASCSNGTYEKLGQYPTTLIDFVVPLPKSQVTHFFSKVDTT